MIETICPFPSPSAHTMLADKGRLKSKDDLQPWTAARCHRLLRQLQCRLGSLRKLVHEARQPVIRRTSKRASLQEEHTRPPKRTRYTYAQRRSTSSNPKTSNPGLSTPPRTIRTLGTMNLGRCSPASERVDFSTPMLRRVCIQPGASNCSPKRDDTTNSMPLSLVAELHSLRRLAPEGHYRIYEAIFGWLSGLLRSNETKSPTPHPKSLLGMCLRRVPAALAEIETWDRQMAEENGTKSVWDSSNASVELYGQLETFGAAGIGSKPLRLVVRAHALSILAEAVSEGLFEPEFVRLLAELYLSFKCAQDAATIVSRLPSQLAGPRSSSSTFDETRKLQPLAVIVKSLQGANRPGASFDCLTSLINSGKLPLTWAYTKGFNAVWATTLEAMATSKPEPSAIVFICTLMEQLSAHKGMDESPKESTTKQALVSVAAGLTAMAVTLGNGNPIDMSLARRPAARRIMHVLDLCVSHLQCHQKTVGEGLFVLAMARYIAMAESKCVDSAVRRQAEEEFRQLAVGDDDASSQTQYRQALFLAISIARYRGRACSMACHDVLSEICTLLDGLGLPDWFRRGLRMDGAFLLAQKTNDLRDLAFAENLPATGREYAEAGTIFSGWRWEEGISEWVLPSPTSKARGGGGGGGCGESLESGRVEGTGGNLAPDRGRGRGWVRGPEGESRKRDGRGISKGGGNTNGHVDGDVDGDNDGDSDGHGDGEEDSGDELSGEWDDAAGICGLGLGNAARTSIVGSNCEPRGRHPGSRSSLSNHRIGNSNDIMGEESPTGRGTRNRSSSSAASVASSSGRQSQSQSWSRSQALAGAEGQPTKGSKRAGPRTMIWTRTGTGAGRFRGMSQRRDSAKQALEDDWDELV
ncbi:hypothetical protein EDB80DRAFT_62149 [Ilyonectria destructans]|nr:hypothetical protein EDB80DRAFT_62149 [Ilyonectria destructans]